MPKNNEMTLTGMVYTTSAVSPTRLDIDLMVTTEFDDGHLSSDLVTVRFENRVFSAWRDVPLKGRTITVYTTRRITNGRYGNVSPC